MQDKHTVACENVPDGLAIIETMHPEPAAATRLLTQVGLSDPYTWCRTPEEISCGQRERLKLAHLLANPGDIIVADEFLHALDEVTAAAVAWTFGRACRKAGKTLLCASTTDRHAIHLRPDIIINQKWRPHPEIETPDWDTSRSPLLDEFTITRGTHQEWSQLSHLHYAAGDPATTHSYWVARHPKMFGPAGVVVYSYPDLHSAARNLATTDAYKIGGSREAAMKLNREVRKLSRIVISPEVRGIGLSRRLIMETVPLLNIRYVETVAAMGEHHGFLKSIGFTQVPQTPAAIEASIYAAADQDQAPPDALLDADILQRWTETLSVRRRREWRRLCWHHWHHFSIHRRTRAPLPKVIPEPGDPRWPSAWAMLSSRIGGRPTYWILGPIGP